jgi:SAM-dependent methyltransferase
MTDSLFNNRRRATSFGDNAEQYDRVRPTYPQSLVDCVLADGAQRILDVGCGTGITSRLFLARGCEVVGLEPDPRMAEVARRSGQLVEVGTIEEFDAGDQVFDLLIAGQSWHWVDPQRAAQKAVSILKPGGRIGLFWNQTHPEPQVSAAIQESYDRHASDLGQKSVLLGLPHEGLYAMVAESLRSNGGFTDVTKHVFEHHATYTTQHWLDLTMTHSDHWTLPPEQLSALLDDLRQMIDSVGGQVPVRYETTLVTGRTREVM